MIFSTFEKISPVVDQTVTSQKSVHILIPGSCECGLIWKKYLCRCNEVKGLEMRSFQMI